MSSSNSQDYKGNLSNLIYLITPLHAYYLISHISIVTIIHKRYSCRNEHLLFTVNYLRTTCAGYTISRRLCWIKFSPQFSQFCDVISPEKQRKWLSSTIYVVSPNLRRSETLRIFFEKVFALSIPVLIFQIPLLPARLHH